MRWLAAVLISAAILSPLHAAKNYGEEQVARLVEIAQSEKEPEGRRAQACRELANTTLRTQVPALHRLLREERSVDIRLCAACTLAQLGDRHSPRDLLLASAYDGTRTPNCSRSDVLLALARIGDPAAEVSLERALKSDLPADEPEYYADACRALGLLNTSGARRLLLTALRDGGPAVRYAAIGALSGTALQRPEPERSAARAALLRAAESDPDEKVAEQAMSALLWSGVDGPAFFALLEHAPEPAVRVRAARVLNRHYLSPARLGRLRAALAREGNPAVRAAMEATLASQHPAR